MTNPQAAKKHPKRLPPAKGLVHTRCACGSVTLGMLMCYKCIKQTDDYREQDRIRLMLRNNAVSDLSGLPCLDCTHWQAASHVCGLHVPEAGTTLAKGCPAYFSMTLTPTYED
jgi:hypothetical protein